MPSATKILIDKITRSSIADGSYIIAGPPGTGKLNFSKKLINQLIDPRDQLANVVIISPQIEQKNKKIRPKEISVSQIRQALEFMDLKSKPESYMVCVIKKAERLNQSAANALLKSLEEPKKGNIFLIITESEEKLLPTIRSRSFLIKIGLTHPCKILKKLRLDSAPLDLTSQVALYSWGRPRIAKSLIKNPLKIKQLEKIKIQLDQIIQAPLWERFKLLEKESDNRRMLEKKIDFWLVYLTALLESSFCPERFSFVHKNIKTGYNSTTIVKRVTVLLELRKQIKNTNISTKLALENAFLD
ncbi:MAG: hypothetical protein ABIH38_04605 [Patescibacteria group bacterium]|nr:AAA family ATPase [Patescibacteria group bacterium]